MTEFECFIFLVGFIAGAAFAFIILTTRSEARPVDHNAPRVRTHLQQ